MANTCDRTVYLMEAARYHEKLARCHEQQAKDFNRLALLSLDIDKTIVLLNSTNTNTNTITNTNTAPAIVDAAPVVIDVDDLTQSLMADTEDLEEEMTTTTTYTRVRPEVKRGPTTLKKRPRTLPDWMGKKAKRPLRL
jgi:hypothetical protein